MYLLYSDLCVAPADYSICREGPRIDASLPCEVVSEAASITAAGVPSKWTLLTGRIRSLRAAHSQRYRVAPSPVDTFEGERP